MPPLSYRTVTDVARIDIEIRTRGSWQNGHHVMLAEGADTYDGAMQTTGKSGRA